jgi:hypothetical protein
VGKDDQYSNPNGYIPAPAASGMPQTLWVTEVMPVAWRGVVGTTDTAFWKSPTFDLRPDLRSGQSMVKAGVPIWDRSARLYVQMFGLTVPGATDNLRVEYREFANTTWGQVTQAGPNRAIANAGFPNQIGRDPVVQIGPTIDITSEVMLGTNQPPSAILVFETLGEGYPVRYWSLELLWTNIGSVAGPPGMSLQAAMY